MDQQQQEEEEKALRALVHDDPGITEDEWEAYQLQALEHDAREQSAEPHHKAVQQHRFAYQGRWIAWSAWPKEELQHLCTALNLPVTQGTQTVLAECMARYYSWGESCVPPSHYDRCRNTPDKVVHRLSGEPLWLWNVDVPGCTFN